MKPGKLSATMGFILAVCPNLPGQAIREPAFEVTSVKPYVEFSRRTATLACNGGHFQGLTVYLELVIAWACDVGLFQLSAGSDQQCKAMVRSLPADRFGLIVHHQTVPTPVFALHAARGGPKTNKVPPEDPSVNGPGFTVNGESFQMLNADLKGWTMEQLATLLSLDRITGLERRVADQTGLEGIYKIALSYTRAGSEGTAPDIRTALTEQLGLRLDPATIPVEMLVIDKVNMPDAN